MYYRLILDRKGLTMGLETLGKEDLTYFGNDSDYLRMIIEFQSDDRIHVKVFVYKIKYYWVSSSELLKIKRDY